MTPRQLRELVNRVQYASAIDPSEVTGAIERAADEIERLGKVVEQAIDATGLTYIKPKILYAEYLYASDQDYPELADELRSRKDAK